MQKLYHLDCILKEIENLKSIVQRDTYNLTRDDHDAIESRIEQLRQFIKSKYDN